MRQAFARAAAAPSGTYPTDFLGAILRERPDLAGQPVYFPGQGSLSYTAIIGDEVFKGPQWEDDTGRLDREHEILKAMEGKGLPVPVVTYVGQKAFFFGMSKTPGVIGSFGIIEQMTPEQRDVFVKDVINFVIGMANAFPPQNGMFMAHGDLKLGNLMIDPETKKLSGIIDVGLAVYTSKEHLAATFTGPIEMQRAAKQEFARRQAEITGGSAPKMVPPEPRL